MKRRIGKAVVVFILFAVVCIGVFFAHWTWKYYQLPLLPDYGKYENLAERAESALAVARRMGLSEKYCLFTDYSIPSGTPRMFVWSFEQERVVASTYVMHGPGMGSTDEVPVFSNKPGSNCSSLGRFAVTHEHGNRNKSGYFIRGLDMDNQSARARGLMIHKALWVDVNCWRDYIPLNSKCCQGCLTISSRGLNFISGIMQSEEKQLLLWSYCSENKCLF